MSTSSSTVHHLFPQVTSIGMPLTQGLSSCSTDPYSQKNLMSIKQFSTVFLGHGYERAKDRQPARILERVLQIFPHHIGDVVRISRPKTRSVAVLKYNFEEVESELRRLIEFDLSDSKCIFEGSERVETLEQSSCETRKIFYAQACVRFMKCELTSILPLRDDISLNNISLGDSFVKSGWVFTGYKIIFEIILARDRYDRLFFLPHGDVQIDFNDSLRRLEKLIDDKRIRSIRVGVGRFGDYSPPDISLPRNVKDIKSVTETILSHYKGRAHRIMVRQFVVDSKVGLGCYLSEIPPLSLPVSSSSSSADSTDLPMHPLVSKIHQFTTGNIRRALDVGLTRAKLKMESMLTAIQTVFSSNIKMWLNHKNPHWSYTLVMGDTDAGKSTFIAFQQGARIQYQKIFAPNGSWFYWKLAYQKEGDFHYPKIGHGPSKTKGFRVYQKYIDVAGFFSSREGEEDVCNMMAICMAIRKFSPNRLIIVLKPSDFSEAKARGLLQKLMHSEGCCETLRVGMYCPQYCF